MLGIPTVLITLVPENSRQMGLPRAIHLMGFTLGACTGGPFQKELQRKVVLDALKRWETRIEPGVIWDIEYPDYQRAPVIEGTGQIVREEVWSSPQVADLPWERSTPLDSDKRFLLPSPLSGYSAGAKGAPFLGHRKHANTTRRPFSFLY